MYDFIGVGFRNPQCLNYLINTHKACTVHSTSPFLKNKADLTNKLAEVFGISPDALSVPDIDSYIGLMHTLFTLEDIYGLTIEKRDGEIIMRVDPFNSREARNLLDELHVWCAEREKYRNGEISKDDYDKWRYNYPKYSNVNFAKAPSQELSEAMAEAFKDKLHKD